VQLLQFCALKNGVSAATTPAGFSAAFIATMGVCPAASSAEDFPFSLLPGPPTPQQPLGSSLADSSSWPSSPDLRTGRFSSGALKASALLVVTAWSVSALLVAKAWNASATAAAAATARPSTVSAASSAAFLLQGHCCS
jgi:hypothetical protein